LIDKYVGIYDARFVEANKESSQWLEVSRELVLKRTLRIFADRNLSFETHKKVHNQFAGTINRSQKRMENMPKDYGGNNDRPEQPAVTLRSTPLIKRNDLSVTHKMSIYNSGIYPMTS